MRKFVASLVLIIAFVVLHALILLGVGVLYLYAFAGWVAGDADFAFDAITIRRNR